MVTGSVLAWAGRYSPTLPMLIGFVLLLTVVPGARLKKFGVGPKTGLTIEFHAVGDTRRAS